MYYWDNYTIQCNSVTLYNTQSNACTTEIIALYNVIVVHCITLSLIHVPSFNYLYYFEYQISVIHCLLTQQSLLWHHIYKVSLKYVHVYIIGYYIYTSTLYIIHVHVCNTSLHRCYHIILNYNPWWSYEEYIGHSTNLLNTNNTIREDKQTSDSAKLLHKIYPSNAEVAN